MSSGRVEEHEQEHEEFVAAAAGLVREVHLPTATRTGHNGGLRL